MLIYDDIFAWEGWGGELRLASGECRLRIIDLKKGKISYRGLEMDMMANRLALYTFFALLKKDCPTPDRQCKSCDRCFLDFDSVNQRQPEITRFTAHASLRETP